MEELGLSAMKQLFHQNDVYIEYIHGYGAIGCVPESLNTRLHRSPHSSCCWLRVHGSLFQSFARLACKTEAAPWFRRQDSSLLRSSIFEMLAETVGDWRRSLFRIWLRWVRITWICDALRLALKTVITIVDRTVVVHCTFLQLPSSKCLPFATLIHPRVTFPTPATQSHSRHLSGNGFALMKTARHRVRTRPGHPAKGVCHFMVLGCPPAN